METPDSKLGEVQNSADVFEFETECLPLRNNPDYIQLTKSLNLLLALRGKALQDINEVLQIQDEALANPLDFLSRLQNGENLNFPERPADLELPKIDWSKYKLQPGEALRPETRPKNRDVFSEAVEQSIESFDTAPVKTEVRPACKKSEVKEKSTTFKQHWTEEEQLKLEELLNKYPPEDNEARRFAKIAKELGNRTLSQVTSRCQKYFQKLFKMGLPIPGRMPRRPERLKNPKSKRRFQSSSFFPRNMPSITNDGSPGTSYVSKYRIKTEVLDPDESLLAEGASSESLKQGLLRRVRAHLDKHGDQPIAQAGFRCTICKDEPLKGTRWHCMQCDNVDICSNCLVTQLEDPDDTNILHPLDHPLASYRPAPIASTLPLADKDYQLPLSSYSYLDPCFHPE